MGIDVDRAHRIAFGIGTGITAIAGGLVATYNPFQPYVGLDFVIIMYAGVVLGGMGSILGAFWGGMTIGLVQQLSTLVLPTQLQNAAIFVVFLLIVLLRPQGLFGRATGADLSDARSGSSESSPIIAVFAIVWIAVGMLVDQNSYYQLMLTLVPIWAVMGLSWNLLSGYTGLISFGHAAFFGLGAYTVTIALVYFDITPWLGIPLAAMVVGGARRHC